MAIRKVQNVYYTARAIDACRDFYERALGLESRFADGQRWVQFAPPGSNFALASREESAAEGGGVVVFESDDGEDHGRLLALGAADLGGRDMGSHGRVHAYRDPAGNVFQLFWPSTAARPAESAGLDSDVLRLVEGMRASGLPKLGEVSAAEMRAARAALAARLPLPPPLPVGHVRDVTMEAEGRALRARFYHPTGNPVALLVFFHGGGWTLGGIESSDPPVRRLCEGANVAVLSVDYRLAPESPFPAAVEDAYSAIFWAAANKELLGAADLPLVVGGESAGANLTAVTTRMARDLGGPAIDAQLLFCPCVSAALHTPVMMQREVPFLTRADIAWFFDQYAPKPEMRADPRFAPLDAGRFDGLPPCFISTAEFDLLREQGEAYAEQLREAGVPVELRRYDGTIHAFLELDGGLRHSRQAIADVRRFLAQQLAEPR